MAIYYEASCIEVVLGWRQVCDQRGQSELERCKCNYKLLNFILEELMPWYRNHHEFSFLEVNRYVMCMKLTILCSFDLQGYHQHLWIY